MACKPAFWFSRSFIVSLMGTLGVLHAQVPDAVKEKLITNNIVIFQGRYYIQVKGAVRGTREAMQSMLKTIAMRDISFKLCGLEPVSGQRLEATISGASVISSELNGSELTIILSAPDQAPKCQMISLPNQDTFETTGPDAVSKPTSNDSSDITVRNFGNDY